MIVDTIAAHSSFVRAFLESAPVISVPMEVYPFDDSDGEPGVLWSGDSSLDPKSKEFPILDCRTARMPYKSIVFRSEHREQGILLASVKREFRDEAEALADVPTDCQHLLSVPFFHEYFSKHHVLIDMWLIGFGGRNGTGRLIVRHFIAALQRNGGVTLSGPDVILLLGDRLSEGFSVDDPRVKAALMLRWIDNAFWMEMVQNNGLWDRYIKAGADRRRLDEVGAEIRSIQDQIEKRATALGVAGFKKSLAQHGITLEREIADIQNDAPNMYAIVVAACAFMNCRNIVLEEVSPTEALQRARRRRGRPPAYTYYRLRVRARGRLHPLVRAGNRKSDPTAIHWRRGHFKSYEERPLFGKRTGLWWWQPHLAGLDYRSFRDKEYVVTRKLASASQITG